MTESTTETTDSETPETSETSETFDREYVTRLRDKSAGYRIRAQEADRRADWWATEGRRLATREAARVAGLVDPEALAWDDAWESDQGIDHQAIEQAARELIKQRPSLGRPRGDVGQGERADAPTMPSLSAILRG